MQVEINMSRVLNPFEYCDIGEIFYDIRREAYMYKFDDLFALHLTKGSVITYANQEQIIITPNRLAHKIITPFNDNLISAKHLLPGDCFFYEGSFYMMLAEGDHDTVFCFDRNMVEDMCCDDEIEVIQDYAQVEVVG